MRKRTKTYEGIDYYEVRLHSEEGRTEMVTWAETVEEMRERVFEYPFSNTAKVKLSLIKRGKEMAHILYYPNHKIFSGVLTKP